VPEPDFAGKIARLEGDHALSLILNKVFLLANDTRIKVPAILNQLRP
jgi:hypothetical protein